MGALGLGWVARFCYIGFSKLHMSREWLEIKRHSTHRQSLYSINLKSLIRWKFLCMFGAWSSIRVSIELDCLKSQKFQCNVQNQTGIMLIPIIDNIRYLNLHVLWLKVEWIDLTFMPCEYFFGTSLKTSNWLILFDDIVVCSLSHQIR